MLRNVKCRKTFFQDEEFNDIIKSSARIEFLYEHFFDEIIVNTDLAAAFKQLLAAANRVETEPLWVPASWVQWFFWCKFSTLLLLFIVGLLMIFGWICCFLLLTFDELEMMISAMWLSIGSFGRCSNKRMYVLCKYIFTTVPLLVVLDYIVENLVKFINRANPWLQ